MAADVKDGFVDRRRASEDEYFRRRDQELVKRARSRAEEEAALLQFSEAAGITDQAVLRDLQQLGYTPETVMLLRIVPLIDVAWADGQVSEKERDLVIAAARAGGAEPGSRADRQVGQWLTSPPSNVLSHGTLHALGAAMERSSPDARRMAVDDLLASCTQVAEAAGGILGYGRISNKEQGVLDRIEYELRRKGAPASDR